MKAIELRETLRKVKIDAANAIEGLMKERGVSHIDFTECCDCPIVIEGDFDEDTYTLDDLRLENGELLFYCSSTDYNAWVNERNIDTGCLISTLEALEKYPELLDCEE